MKNLTIWGDQPHSFGRPDYAHQLEKPRPPLDDDDREAGTIALYVVALRGSDGSIRLTIPALAGYPPIVERSLLTDYIAHRRDTMNQLRKRLDGTPQKQGRSDPK